MASWISIRFGNNESASGSEFQIVFGIQDLISPYTDALATPLRDRYYRN
jgi:hypothetical protein